MKTAITDPIAGVIRQRYSCRAYEKRPVLAEEAEQLAAFARETRLGPLGTPLRFELAVALEHDPKALRGLGTYGLIRHAAGFVIGAAGPGAKNLEDFGYGMEAVVLRATGMGLGTCWLGGNFTKSSFSRRINATGDEVVPAVVALGYPASGIRARDPLRRIVKADARLPWRKLFFLSGFGTPLPVGDAGAFAAPLEMVRLAPSSHNYQPWRVVQDDGCYHFYLRRTAGYGPGTPAFVLLGMADLQRVDMGIAMCHFELAAKELGLEGRWGVEDPGLQDPDKAVEYVVTWSGA